MKRHIHKTVRRRNRQRGGILILCTVLAGLGTLGVVAWVSLLQARSIEAETQEAATDRFIRKQNSRALAREVLYRKYLAADSGPAEPETYTLPDGWGGVEIGDWSGSALSYSAAVRTHKAGAVPFRAFSTDVSVAIDDGDATHTCQYQLKSYNPMLGGSLLTVQRATLSDDTPLTISGDLRVHGRALFWGDDYGSNTFGALTDSAQISDNELPNLPFTDTGDNSIRPANFPFPATTSGAVDGTANYIGQASVIVNATTTANAYASRAISAGATEISGDTAFVETDAAATYPATTFDPTLIAVINQVPAPLDTDLVEALSPYHPLSSTVLTTLLARTTPAVSSASLKDIFLASSPLPRDVLTQIAQDTLMMSAGDKTAVFDANPIGVLSDGTGTITVDLDQTCTTHVVATGGITRIVIKGQTSDANYTLAGYMAPLIFTFQNSGPASIASIEFRGRNNRRAVFAFHQGLPFGPVAVTFTGATAFPNWRGLFEMEGVVASIDAGAVSSVNIVGGIRTDHSLAVSSGAVNLSQETELTTLEELASRNAWIEAYETN